MVDKAKLSKIKNVFGESHKYYFEDIKPVEVSTDGQIVDINTHFVAVKLYLKKDLLGKYWRRNSSSIRRLKPD